MTALDYRHWDTWNEGKFNHVLYKENTEGAVGVDILGSEIFDSPQKPFGGDEDYIWVSRQINTFYTLVRKKRARNMPSPQIQIFTNTI